jgi:hypothetical protein
MRDAQLLARGDASYDNSIRAVQAGRQVVVVFRQLVPLQHDPALSEQSDLAGNRGGCAGMITGDHRDLDVSRTTGS